MEINGVGHVVLRVSRFEKSVDFCDRLMPELGLQAVHRREGFVYYVGGRTALCVRRAETEYARQAHVEAAPVIDHLYFRAPSGPTTTIARASCAELVMTWCERPQTYDSLSFRDPEGTCLEVNHVPDKGVLGFAAAYNPGPGYPLANQSRS